MRVRQAEAADASSVQGIVHAAYAPYVERLGKPPGPMLDDYPSRIASDQVWVLGDAGRIIGVLVLEDRPHGLLLDNIAVAPAAQGRGYGRALIGFAEAEARRRGHPALLLYTHVLMVENLALYGRLGFAETGRVSEKGFDRVYMARSVKAVLSAQ